MIRYPGNSKTLQRKLHVSQKQYVGQNESDMCATWVEITLWIHQGVSVQSLLIVQMDPCCCCRRSDQKRTRVFRAIRCKLWEETIPKILGEIIINGDFLPVDSRKGAEHDRPGLISHLPRVEITARNAEWSSGARGLRFYTPTTLFPVSTVTNNTQRSSKCNFPKLDEDEFRVGADALFIVIILSILSVGDVFEFKGKDEVIEQRGWITHSGKMALYLFLNV